MNSNNMSNDPSCDLPPNWEKRLDSRTGWPYYINHTTKTTHWEHPSQASASTNKPGAPPTGDLRGVGGSGIQIPVQQNNSSSRLDGSHSSHQHSGHQNGSVERDRSPIPPSPRRSPAPPGSAGRGRGQSGRKTPTKMSQPKLSPSDAALDTIDGIRKDAEGFHVKIETFVSSKESKDYKYLEEMMERNLLKLDNVETHGVDEIRLKRKETVKYIQECLDQLELKALSNDTD